MNTIGSRELRANLADVIAAARNGADTIITAHGRPVARVAPLDEAAPDLDRLIAAGSVIPPRREDELHLPEPVPIAAGVRVDQALRELRG